VDGLVPDPQVPTSHTLVLLTPGGERMFLHDSGANDAFGAADVATEALAGVRLFHLGYPALMRRLYRDEGEELARLFARVKAQGLTTSLDMSLPDADSEAGRVDWRALLARVLPHVDVFVPSLDETLYMLRRELFDARVAEPAPHEPVSEALVHELLAELAGLGPAIVGVKLGARGMALRTADERALHGAGAAVPHDLPAWAGRELWMAAFAVEVVGTLGAGDAAVAGLLAGLLRGEPPERALELACAAGACCAERADAVSGVRDLDTIHRRLTAGWPRLPGLEPGAGWRGDARAGLRFGPDDTAGTNPSGGDPGAEGAGPDSGDRPRAGGEEAP
jgi:sugar/nucleoside kinase (ribokinase family)